VDASLLERRACCSTSIGPYVDPLYPDLLKFPIVYLSEPGYWHPSESEVLGLRTYLQKGGLLIVVDFHFENEWRVFESAMRRVLSDARIRI